MPYNKSTQRDYGDSPLDANTNGGYSPFKMKGFSPFTKSKSTLTNEQKLAAANRRKEEGISKAMAKYNISKKDATAIWTKQNPPLPQPPKPSKT